MSTQKTLVQSGMCFAVGEEAYSGPTDSPTHRTRKTWSITWLVLDHALPPRPFILKTDDPISFKAADTRSAAVTDRINLSTDLESRGDPLSNPL